MLAWPLRILPVPITITPSGSPEPRRKISPLTLRLGLVALGLGGYYFGVQLPRQRAALQKQKEAARLAAQRQAAEQARPHLAIEALIQDLSDHGQELPPCPLIFPLLNEKKKVTALGSYLSFLGMKKAAYLPEAAYRLPNAGEIFQDFLLFNPKPDPVQKMYLKELPFRFMAKDFAEGTLRRNRKGYQITLRFHGTRPAKKFSKTFPKKRLHLAPSWIGACVHQWTGFKPSPAQAAYRDEPIFTNDADFQKGAADEVIIRRCPALVCGWDKILAAHPDSSFLMDRWLSIQQDREKRTHPEILDPLFQKSPEDFSYRFDKENQLIGDKHYEEALDLIFEDLKGDDNNSMWYEMAVEALEDWGFYPEAIKLVNLWRTKHPENQEAWMALASLYLNYAWQARGSGFANTVTEEGARLMEERMVEADKAGQEAAQLAPGDCRTWSKLLALGVGVPYDKAQMKSYFDKVLALNPYHYQAYNCYLNYLQPKWFGEEGEAIALVRKYENRMPFLIYDTAAETFYDYSEPKNEAETRAQRQVMAENVRNSPYLSEFQEGMKRYFLQGNIDNTYWSYYCYWMCSIGKRDDCLALAKKMRPKGQPEMRAFYPTLVLLTLEQDVAARAVNHAEAAAIENKPETLQLKGDALKALVKADPANWAAWNQLAQFEGNAGRLAEARKCFEAIGDHRMEWVWNAADFNKAKRAAQGLPPILPTPFVRPTPLAR